ncbi:hypothetical protein SFMTTN_2058 [Sulfuriferula multivorans]|uniref:Uncharacterized protein n=1 Tax=Sulfuriferula multivorans TaxID=1559896 RepID=A0A401JF39_9PROT|nr:hypothetical protein [Sulfuriferula multivorans]GBL46245.1 hypothetical protein SFMTTN_2058 [Sulfuriferula multivorans]
MSEQHKSLRDEILFVLGRASAPLNTGEIYERCQLAEEVKAVANAVWGLRTAGKIELIDAPGRKAYKLADGTKVPAPAGQAGRPKAAEPVVGGININNQLPVTESDPAFDRVVHQAEQAVKIANAIQHDVAFVAAKAIPAFLLKPEPIKVPHPPRFLVDDAGALEIEDDDTTLRMEARDVKRLLKFLTAVKELA